MPHASDATKTMYARVLTAGTSNDFLDYHNSALLVSKASVTVSDVHGSVAEVAVEVSRVREWSRGTAYKITLRVRIVVRRRVALRDQCPPSA